MLVIGYLYGITSERRLAEDPIHGSRDAPSRHYEPIVAAVSQLRLDA